MNRIIITGNIVKDIEIGVVNANQKDYQVIKNSLAVKRPFKNKNGEYETDFIDFQVWGNQCKYLKDYAYKGCKVCVSGRLQCRTWQDDSGRDRKTWEIVADEVEILVFKDSNTTKKEETKAEEKVDTNVDPFANFRETEKKETSEPKIGFDDLPF